MSNIIKPSDLHHQCCVCMMPPAPEGHDRYAVSHGYHRTCWVVFYTQHDPEMVEEDLAYLDEGGGWLPEVAQAT